jgi:beta-lactamase regulating signal transducer with metallopeptidase domain
MDSLLNTALSNALVALALAVVVVLAALVCRRPALLHGLWLLVLLKLITPPLVQVELPWPALGPSAESAEPPLPEPTALPAPGVAEPLVAAPVVREETPVEPTSEAPRVGAVLPPLVEPAVEIEPAPVEPALVASAETPQLRAGRWTWQPLLLTVWLAGSLAWFTLAIVRMLRFQRLLRHARPASDALRKQVESLAAEMGIQQPPGVWLLPGRLAPMLWAVGGSPRLLLPAELLEHMPGDQQATLLMHELAHLKRGDHWVRLLEFVACGLYWWHPVVWYACRELREAEEQCCDAWVVSTLPESGRTYATALVETLDFLSEARSAVPALASGIGHVSDLKRRLTMIMRGTTPRSLTWHGFVGVMVLGGLLLPLLPTWAQDNEKAGDFYNRTKNPGSANFYYGLVEAETRDDLDSIQKQMKKLEQALEKKRQEMAAAEKKLADLAAKMKQSPRSKGAGGGGMGGGTTESKGVREIVLREVNGRWTIVSGPNQAVGRGGSMGGMGLPPGMGQGGFGGMPGMAPMGPGMFPGGNPYKLTPPPVLPPQGPMTPGQPALSVPPNLPGGSDAEGRIEKLEKKLQELEKLIRELKKHTSAEEPGGSQPGNSPFGAPPSRAGGPGLFGTPQGGNN